MWSNQSVSWSRRYLRLIQTGTRDAFESQSITITLHSRLPSVNSSPNIHRAISIWTSITKHSSHLLLVGHPILFKADCLRILQSFKQLECSYRRRITMGLLDVFFNDYRSPRHRNKRAPWHDTRPTHRTRETTVASAASQSSTPSRAQAKDRVQINNHSRQSRNASSSSMKNSHVTVVCVGATLERSPSSYKANHSETASQRPKQHPLLSPSKNSDVFQCGENVSTAHEYAKRGKTGGSSAAGVRKHGLAVPKEITPVDTKHVNLHDHFPSPTLDPSDDHPANRHASPSPPALPPRPCGRLQSLMDNHSTDSSSPTSARSSPCASAITEATTVIPEEMVPRNPQQEYLRQLSRVGFAIERQVCYPMFGKKQVSFEVSKQRCGYISHRVDSITRKGRSIVFPRNTTGTRDSSEACSDS